MLKFELLNEVPHGVFGREFFDAEDSRAGLCCEFGISVDDLFFADQIHSRNVYVAMNRPSANKLSGYDAFVSNVPGLFFMVKVADCQGVLLFDPVARVIAAVHSGWRGSVLNILGEVMRVMRDLFGCDPANILAGISPSIGPCCCRFSDPRSELPTSFQKYILPDNKVDFWKCSEDQLSSCGVKPENIENMRICTVCNSDRFFSYRKEGGRCGKNSVIIGLP